MHPRRYSQVERALGIFDKSSTTDALKDNQFLLYLFKKTERIVAALYILTGPLSDDEPLKAGLRTSGIRLLKDILSWTEGSATESRESVHGISASLAGVMSLIELAHIMDCISSMNFTILKKEIAGILEGIEARGRTLFTSPLPHLDEAFFGLSQKLFEEPKVSGERSSQSVHNLAEFEHLKRTQKDIYKGHDVLNSVLYTRNEATLPATVPKHIETRPTGGLKIERKEKIVALVREKKSAMIKDFAPFVQGCGEKTIQRLLVELVREGVLKREGERRWSRYLSANS